MWTLDEHVQCAKDTSAWFNCVNFYIDQMHDCKFEPKRQKKGKFKPLTEEADQLYCRALFYKKLGRSSFDVFPSSFKCILEECMFREHEHDERCTTRGVGGKLESKENLNQKKTSMKRKS